MIALIVKLIIKFKKLLFSKSFLHSGQNPKNSVLTIAFGALVFSACQDPGPRSYTEIAFKPNPSPQPQGGAPSAGPMMDPAMGEAGGTAGAGPMSGPGGPMAGGMPGRMMAPATDIKVTWKLPSNWVVKDSANGMRIGSFGIPDSALAYTGELEPEAVDVSVVQLSGQAGGLKPNIMRWMGQIAIKASADELDAFIKAAPHFKTRSGQEGMYIDLTEKLSGDMTQNKSIFAAIVQTADYTVFVKAMGEIKRVIHIKPEVKKFCLSLKIESSK